MENCHIEEPTPFDDPVEAEDPGSVPACLDGFKCEFAPGKTVEVAMSKSGDLLFHFERPVMESDKSPELLSGQMLAPGQSQFVMDGRHVSLISLSVAAADAMVHVMHRVLAAELVRAGEMEASRG